MSPVDSSLLELARAPFIRPLDLALKEQLIKNSIAELDARERARDMTDLIAGSLARLAEAEASSPNDALPEMPHSEKKAASFP